MSTFGKLAISILVTILVSGAILWISIDTKGMFLLIVGAIAVFCFVVRVVYAWLFE